MSDQITRLLDDIERLAKEATKGPWYGVMDDLTDVVQVVHDQEQRSHVANIGDKTLDRVWPDAELIALARITLPTLANAVRAVLKECQEAQDRFDSTPYDQDREGQARLAEIIETTITDAMKVAGND